MALGKRGENALKDQGCGPAVVSAGQAGAHGENPAPSGLVWLEILLPPAAPPGFPTASGSQTLSPAGILQDSYAPHRTGFRGAWGAPASERRLGMSVPVGPRPQPRRPPAGLTPPPKTMFTPGL